MATMRPFKPFSGMIGVEEAWGSDPYLVAVAQKTGINAIDLETLAELCRQQQFLMIIRSPGGIGRSIVGIGGVPIKPKPASFKTEKTGGKWIKKDGTYYVSDYDLLSVWQLHAGRYAKVPLPDDDWRTEEFLMINNRELVMPFQHGANDDYLDAAGKPKNTAIGNQFTVIPPEGAITIVEGIDKLKAFYAANGLVPWLYS